MPPSSLLVGVPASNLPGVYLPGMPPYCVCISGVSLLAETAPRDGAPRPLRPVSLLGKTLLPCSKLSFLLKTVVSARFCTVWEVLRVVLLTQDGPQGGISHPGWSSGWDIASQEGPQGGI